MTPKGGQPWEPVRHNDYEERDEPERVSPGGAPAEFVDTTDRNVPGEHTPPAQE